MAGGGTLCWYYTNEGATKQKLTSSCVRPGQSAAATAQAVMPVSGPKQLTVQLECFDFSNFWGTQDTCIDNYDYNQAVANKKSCGAASGNTMGCSAISIRNFALSCEAVSFTVTPSKTSVSLFSGQSETITITVKNNMAYPIACNQNIGTISAGGSNSNYKLTVQAPATGTGTNTESASVVCNWQGGTSKTETAVIAVNYQSDPCVAALNDAKSSVTDAQTAVTSSQSKIQEADTLGADVTTAKSSLNQANSQLSTSQTTLTTAQTSCNSGDRTNGVTQANTAKSAALQAKQYATDALNMAQSAITTFTQKKTEASNKISDATSAIANSVLMVQKAEAILNNVIALGQVMPEAVGNLDLVMHKSNVDTAKAKIDQAKQYKTDAQSAFDQKNFDLATSKSNSANQLAADANSLATDSYTKINTVMGTLGEGAKSIIAASAEIDKTDGILTKMAFIMKNMEKRNIDLTEAKDIISTGQTNIDAAKDLLSQAKNRLQAGISSDAITKAVAARDKAAEPTNRLNRIISSLSQKTQDALEKDYADANAKANDAEGVVKDAANTYMATQSEINEAQNNLGLAKSQLTAATTAISELKTANDLTTFVEKASSAFSVLDDVAIKVDAAVAHSNAAKMGLYVKVGAGVAVTAGAAGAGFLYFRKRKITKQGGTSKSNDGEHATKQEPTKSIGTMEEKKSNLCSKCNAKLGKNHKFCPSCGEKL